MRRREFITFLGGAAASATLPVAARGQQGDVRRIAFLQAQSADEQILLNAFEQELGKLGWRKGQNLDLDVQIVAPGQADHAAVSIMTRAPHAIVVVNSPNLRAVTSATKSIPIVFAQVSDPVAQGFVSNLARPGGHITGFTNFESSMSGKWLQLLKDITPKVSRVLIVFNPATVTGFLLKSAERYAPSLSLALTKAPVANLAEAESAIAAFAQTPRGGLVFIPDPFNTAHTAELSNLVGRYRLPAIYPRRAFAESGGLASYNHDIAHVMRNAASYVDRILKGASPGDLPVQQPTKFELVINLKAAKTLGLDIPPMLLARADEVIE